MYDYELRPLPSVRPSAIKWGLRHVGISMAIVLLGKGLSAVFSGVSADVGSLGWILTNILAFVMYFGSFGVSFYMIYAGMKDYKANSKSPFFPFMSAMKWATIFVLLYLVVYGACSLVLKLVFMYSLGRLNVDSIMSLPLLWLGPLFLYVVVLSVIGFVAGLILKTD